MKKLIVAALCGLVCASVAVAEEAGAGSKENLTENASASEVQKDLDEPDGVSLAMGEDGSYQIFARGTGIYDFNDADDVADARKEAALKAKAALAKFLNEVLSTSEGLESVSKKAKTLTKNGDVSSAAVSKETVKTTTESIRNSAAAILTGVITLVEKKIPDGEEGGSIQITVGISSVTLEAAKEIGDGIADSINNRKAVTGPGTGAKSRGNAAENGSGKGTVGKGDAKENNGYTKKNKTLF